MKKTPARIPKKMDSEDREALVYWFIGVLFTLFPTLASICAALALSKPLIISDDEIMMLACLILMPTLLDYFRYRKERSGVHTLWFVFLLLFLFFCAVIYGIDKASERMEIRPVSACIMTLSILLSYVAEMTLRGLIKMDKITLVQNTLSALTIIVGLLGAVMGFLFLRVMKAVNRAGGSGEHHVDVFVNGRRTDAANLKADDVDALIHTMNPDERAALKKRLEETENQDKQE